MLPTPPHPYPSPPLAAASFAHNALTDARTAPHTDARARQRRVGGEMKRLTEEESGEETEKTGEKMEIMTLNKGRVESCGTKWGTRRKNTRRWWNCVRHPLTNNIHRGLSVNTPQQHSEAKQQLYPLQRESASHKQKTKPQSWKHSVCIYI